MKHHREHGAGQIQATSNTGLTKNKVLIPHCGRLECSTKVGIMLGFFLCRRKSQSENALIICVNQKGNFELPSNGMCARLSEQLEGFVMTQKERCNMKWERYRVDGKGGRT